MSLYIAKCGREISKSGSAATTGYRDDPDCAGCPYRLAYGPYSWDEDRHAMVTDVKGHECRVTREMTWETGLQGDKKGKNSLHILSLDFDFLERVTAWIRESYPEQELSCCAFNRQRIRSAEYESSGRYSFGIYPAGNRLGIAAKAKLLETFFDADGHRLDMTPEEEKQKIFRDIDEGRAAAKKKEKNMDYIVAECSRNGSTYAWARNTFWVWDKNVKKWFESGFARELFEKAKAKDPILTETDYFTFSDEFVGMDDWEISTEMLAALEQATKGEMAPGEEVSADEVSTSSVAAVAAPPSPQGEGLAAFDYTGLSEKTVATLHVAEKMIKDARKQYILDVADAVGLAHDELCGTGVRNSDTGKFEKQEDTFRAWCASMGISRTTAYQLLQVSELFCGSTPNEQKVLEQASPSLLYAAAKPSAPAELVQQVKDGDIKTHKEFREMEAAWKAAEKRAEDLKAELISRDADVSRLAADAEKAERERDQKAEALRASQEYARKAEARAVVAEREAAQAKRKVDQQEEMLEELQDLYDEKRIQLEDLQAASAAPVEAVMADQEEIDRRVKAKVDAWVEEEEAKWEELCQSQEKKISRLEKESGMAGHIRAMTRMVDSLLNGLLDDVLHEEAPDLHIVNAAYDLYKALDYWCDRFFEFVEGDTRHDDDDE